MTLVPGTRIGAYEIVAPLGAGGMGEVYRATDTVLRRNVALKVLPRDAATDPERLARLRREAELLAALNHPHIAHLYGLESSGGSLALAMELVDGPTLADRISHGPIPLGEALAIADAVAGAIEAAHEQGIVHRDLKPANIKVRDDGAVKVLDFGLAKAMPHRQEPSGPLPSDAATVVVPPISTGIGVIVGTVAYMSPEQLNGKPADKKSDVWAFGCVVYEMLTGRAPFGGDDFAAVTASIVRDAPDWSKLPAVPPAVASLLAGCLEKNPRERVGDMAVARFAIREATRQPAAPAVASVATSPAPRRRWLPWTVAAAALLAAAASLVIPRRAAEVPDAPVRLSADLGRGVTLPASRGSDIAISRDGTQIAVIGFGARGPQILLRRLDQPGFVPIAGTDGARMPFFSPDGTWIGYFVEPTMYRVPTTGGAPVAVCEVGDGTAGAWWGDDNRIVAGLVVDGKIGLWSVPWNGGTLTLLSQNASGAQPGGRWPQVLPGGNAVIFTRLNGNDPPNILVQELPGGTPKLLVKNAFYARYAAPGRLVFARGNTLYVSAFDPRRLVTEGDAVPLVDGVSANTSLTLMSAQYAVSDTGTLVYTTGGGTAAQDRSPLTLLGRDGSRSLLVQGLSWRNVAFSPDGNELAFEGNEPNKPSDVVVYDLRTGRSRAMILDPTNGYTSPIWSPDGKRIVFAARRKDDQADHFNLYWRYADGSGTVHRLTTSNAHQFPGGWHPSGKWIVYHEIPRPGAGDIYALPVDTDPAGDLRPGKPEALVDSPATELAPSVSPDGRWLAYVSSQTGRTEVFVRPFRGEGGPWVVSLEGGTAPQWSSKGELLFNAGVQVMAAHYAVAGATIRFDRPQPWPGAVLAAGNFRRWTVSPDGERLAGGLTDPDAERFVNVVLHVFDSVKAAPAR